MTLIFLNFEIQEPQKGIRLFFKLIFFPIGRSRFDYLFWTVLRLRSKDKRVVNEMTYLVLEINKKRQELLWLSETEYAYISYRFWQNSIIGYLKAYLCKGRVIEGIRINLNSDLTVWMYILRLNKYFWK